MLRTLAPTEDDGGPPKLAVAVVLMAALVVGSLVAAQTAAGAGSTTVSLSPESTAVDPGNTTTVDVVVESADRGVKSYEFTVEITDPAVATIERVDPKGDPGFSDTEIADDGSSVTVTAAAADTADDGAVTIASLVLRGNASGDTTLTTSVETLGDEENDAYTVLGTSGASVSVERRESAPDPGPTAVRLSPRSPTVDDGTTTVDAVVESADGGVKSYEFTVEVADPAVAAIESVDPNGDPEFSDIDIAEDGSSATVTAAAADTDDSGSVAVASLTVGGLHAGETELSLSVETLGNEANEAYNVTEVNGARLTIGNGSEGPESRWRPATAGDANATIHNGSAMDFRVYKCSDANATAHLGEVTGNLTIALGYTVTAEEWHEKAYVAVFEDGTEVNYSNRKPDDGIRKSEYATETGRFVESVFVDGNVSVEIGIRPSDFCSNPDHANTYFQARDIELSISSRVDPPGSIDPFSETSSLDEARTTPDSLAGKLRIESFVAADTTVELLRNSSRNYSLAVTGPDDAENVTVYLQERAISPSNDVENLTMYIDGTEQPFEFVESAGPGASSWVAFNVPAFSTRMISFETNATTTCVAGAVSGRDDTISLSEVQTAINWWAEGTEVPGTGGETISLSEIQSLINAWAEGETVSCRTPGE